MSTTTRRDKGLALLRTMLLGVALALGIGLVAGEPDMAWLGFALAAMETEARRGRSCMTRPPRRIRT